MEYYPLEQCAEGTNDDDRHVVDEGVLDGGQNLVRLHLACYGEESVHKLLIHNYRSPLSTLFILGLLKTLATSQPHFDTFLPANSFMCKLCDT